MNVVLAFSGYALRWGKKEGLRFETSAASSSLMRSKSSKPLFKQK